MIGIGNISYAYPVDIPNTGLGDSFETAAPGDYIVGNGALGTFPVQMYFCKKTYFSILNDMCILSL